MDKLNLSYEMNPDGPDEIIEETTGSNSYLALREVRWKESAPFKLDLRKYFMKPDGTEIPGKGISFMTPDGPSTLINTLLDLGNGNTKEVISHIDRRPDFLSALAYSFASLEEKEIKDAMSTILDESEKYKNQKVQSATDLLGSILEG